MNNCEKFRNMICTYVDGELSESDQSLLFEHIKTCYECKTELDMMQKTRECLKNMPVMPLPEGFSEAFRKNLTNDEIKETKEKVVPFYKKWRTYTSVAAVILFVFVLKSGLTDKSLLLTEDAPPKQNITSQAELSMGSDNSEAPEIIANVKEDIVSGTPETTGKKRLIEPAPEVYSDDIIADVPAPAAELQNDTAMPEEAEVLPEAVPESNENSGIAVASETDETLPEVRVSGGGSAGGGGGSSSVVYRSVYRATDNIATVFVSESDFSLASALFDIMLYTPAEIENILTRNKVEDFSIKTPIGEFDGYYVKVEIK